METLFEYVASLATGVPMPTPTPRPSSPSRGYHHAAAGTAYEVFMGFVHAVNWREPAILCLLGFHLAWILLCWSQRSRPNVHAALFLATCGAVWAAQFLNVALAQHWRAVGFTQDYFDARGVFISTLFSAPLLLVAFCQLMHALMLAVSLMVKIKRRQLMQRGKKGGGEGKEAPTAAAAAAEGAAGGGAGVGVEAEVKEARSALRKRK